MPEPTLHTATRDDIAALLELYRTAGIGSPEGQTLAEAEASWARLAAVPGSEVLLARLEGRPVGTLTLFVLPLLGHAGANEALVEDVAVHPDTQGSGVGRALIEEAMRRASKAGCYKLALSSNLRRESAHAFYEHLGFTRHGVSFVVPLPGA